ncbi:unnamed protein product, partial [Amoebophrya sp. A25]
PETESAFQQTTGDTQKTAVGGNRKTVVARRALSRMRRHTINSAGRLSDSGGNAAASIFLPERDISLSNLIDADAIPDTPTLLGGAASYNSLLPPNREEQEEPGGILAGKSTGPAFSHRPTRRQPPDQDNESHCISTLFSSGSAEPVYPLEEQFLLALVCLLENGTGARQAIGATPRSPSRRLPSELVSFALREGLPRCYVDGLARIFFLSRTDRHLVVSSVDNSRRLAAGQRDQTTAENSLLLENLQRPLPIRELSRLDMVTECLSATDGKSMVPARSATRENATDSDRLSPAPTRSIDLHLLPPFCAKVTAMIVEVGSSGAKVASSGVCVRQFYARAQRPASAERAGTTSALEVRFEEDDAQLGKYRSVSGISRPTPTVVGLSFQRARSRGKSPAKETRCCSKASTARMQHPPPLLAGEASELWVLCFESAAVTQKLLDYFPSEEINSTGCCLQQTLTLAPFGVEDFTAQKMCQTEQIQNVGITHSGANRGTADTPVYIHAGSSRGPRSSILSIAPASEIVRQTENFEKLAPRKRDILLGRTY